MEVEFWRFISILGYADARWNRVEYNRELIRHWEIVDRDQMVTYSGSHEAAELSTLLACLRQRAGFLVPQKVVLP